MWFRNAVVYDVVVPSFYDSNADGIGDLPGLTSRLAYIRELGATAICLSPFYPSPLRDSGYDIADFVSVHPSYGRFDDFATCLDEAHRLELKVIIELVISHTSDQHQWFRDARTAGPGSPEYGCYVWSETSDRYVKARIIRGKTETSNWTWDATAGAFYWHRFYSHEPDLNFDSPLLRQRMIGTVDHWLQTGVDGLKLVGAPFLYERDGTDCEGLPETHAFLQALRRHVDARFADRLLLVEADARPADAAAYFGLGDECHACVHSAINTSLFLALQREQSAPIVEALRQTPNIPDTARWAFRLRGAGALPLATASDDERRDLVRSDAAETRRQNHDAINRRLAPLLLNDRRRLELMNTLLIALPGTPIVYYGDEIGMGDNTFLHEDSAVRTPMQWNGDRNAGFSRATPSRLSLPVVMAAGYSYEALNVEVQSRSQHSLLQWMKQLLALRRAESTLAEGSLKVIESDNPKTLVFLRNDENGTILVAANLSRSPQVLRCNLLECAGMVPVDLVGETTFPDISDRPYFLSLTPYACLLFRLHGEPTLYHSCFISYSTHDTGFAERLYADLSFKGVKCWFAPEDVKIGDRFRQRIHDSIRTHDKLLLVLSESSIRSQWVEDEVESALATERKDGRLLLFPVRIDDAVMESEEGWAETLRNTRHIADFRLWKEHDAYVRALARLLRDLKTQSNS